MEIILERLDLACDVLAIVLIGVGVALLWRMYRAIEAVRDIGVRIIREIESSSGRLETARENINRLTDEIHQRELATIERRLKALEDRAGRNPTQTRSMTPG